MADEAAVLSLSDKAKELAEACNEKHVRVVQAILSGEFESNTAAYLSIYTESTRDAANSSVAAVLAIPSVKALHAQLKEERLLEGILTRSEAMKILSDMASTPISDLVTFSTVDAGTDDDGNPVKQSVWAFKDSALLDEGAMRSISELAATREGLKIKQHDQKAAIKQLAEMAGWDAAKKIEHSGRLATINGDMSLEEASRLFEDNLKSLRD